VKRRNRNRRSPQFVDPDFAAALESDPDAGGSRGRHEQYKALQLCRQVQRALNLALAAGSADEGLNDLFVEEVRPAPDCGHLLVHVAVPAGRALADALRGLARHGARLRSEVAAAITRKRAPALSFVPARTGGSHDE